MAANKPLEFLMNDIDLLVAEKIDERILHSEDIRRNLATLAEYRGQSNVLADAIRMISADQTKAQTLLAKRTQACADATQRLPQARKTLRSCVKPLGRRIKTNREAILITNKEIEKRPVDRERLEASNAERRAIIIQLASEIKAATLVWRNSHTDLQKAKKLQKQSTTRVANLTKQLAEANQAFDAHAKQRESMAELAKKTYDHMRNRQAKHDRKAARRQQESTAIEVIDAAPAEAHKAPTDEDIRNWASTHGLSLDNEHDLVAARELYASA